MLKLTLSWAAVDPAFYVTNYRVWGTLGPGMQQLLGETDQTTFVLEGLATGVWRFQVSAVNMAGEGPQSAIVNGPAVPAPPTGVVLSIQSL